MGRDAVKLLAAGLRKVASFSRDTTYEDSLDARRWAQYMLIAVHETGANLLPLENLAIACAITSGTTVSEVIQDSGISRYLIRLRLLATPEIARFMSDNGPLRGSIEAMRTHGRRVGADGLFACTEVTVPTERYWESYLEPDDTSPALTPEASSLAPEWSIELESLAGELDAADNLSDSVTMWSGSVLRVLASARESVSDFEGFLLRYALSVDLKPSLVASLSGVSLRVIASRVVELEEADFALDGPLSDSFHLIDA